MALSQERDVALPTGKRRLRILEILAPTKGWHIASLARIALILCTKSGQGAFGGRRRAQQTAAFVRASGSGWALEFRWAVSGSR